MNELYTLMDQIRSMPDQALQQVAQMNSNNAAIVAAVMSEVSRRQKIRAAGAPTQAPPQETVRERMFSGLASAPVEVGMADGGIVAFADGGRTPTLPGTMEDAMATQDMRPFQDAPLGRPPQPPHRTRRRAGATGWYGVPKVDAVVPPAAPPENLETKGAQEYTSVGLQLPAPPRFRPAEVDTQGYLDAIKQSSEQYGKDVASVYGPEARAKALEGQAKPEDVYREREGRLKKELADVGVEKVNAKNMALLQAGLAIMSGESPNALKNIGAGAMQGLAVYKDEIKLLKAAAERKREGLELIEEARRQQAANNLAEARAFDAQGREAMLNAQKIQQDALTRALGNELGIRANRAIANMQAESAMARATYGAGVTRALYKTQSDEQKLRVRALENSLNQSRSRLRDLENQLRFTHIPAERAAVQREIDRETQNFNAILQRQTGYGGLSLPSSGYTPSSGAGMAQGFSVEQVSE